MQKFVADQISLPMPLPAIFTMTDRNLTQNFCGAVIIRDYDHPTRETYARGIIRRAKGPILIAGDIGLARRLKADGVHVPQWQLSRLPRRMFCPKAWIFTVSCHSLLAMKRAQLHPLVHAVIVSPVFATKSHPETMPLGMVRFGLMVRQCRMPVMALGGLKRTDLQQIRAVGGQGIALRSGG